MIKFIVSLFLMLNSCCLMATDIQSKVQAFLQEDNLKKIGNDIGRIIASYDFRPILDKKEAFNIIDFAEGIESAEGDFLQVVTTIKNPSVAVQAIFALDVNSSETKLLYLTNMSSTISMTLFFDVLQSAIPALQNASTGYRFIYIHDEYGVKQGQRSQKWVFYPNVGKAQTINVTTNDDGKGGAYFHIRLAK